jgi:hypothetical protein
LVLEQPPLSVNVILINDVEQWPEAQSLVEGSVVVPIMPERKRQKTRSLQVKGASEVFKFFDFGFELAFAVTYHKVQGMTLPKIILDFNGDGHASLTAAQVYVGISRVRRGNDVRILPLRPGSAKKLADLEFRKEILAWRASNHYSP